MQSRYGFDFSLSGSVIVSFSVRVDVLSFGLTVGWAHGLWFPFAITAGEFGSLGARVTRAPGPGKSEEGEPQDGIFQGILRLKISGGAQGPWQVAAEPLFLSWTFSCHLLPRLGFLLSLSVLLM